MREPYILEQKTYRIRARWKRWKSIDNFRRNREKKSERKKKRRRLSKKPKRVLVPRNFSMQANLNGVIEFFQSLNNFHKLDLRQVQFDFSEVENISNGAITILLSHIGWLKDHGIISGWNYPIHREAKKFLVTSGFLSFFKTIGTRYYQKSLNDIVARGQVHTDSELTAKLIRETTKTIWGIKDRNLKIQGLLVELMANTVNHAYFSTKNQKGWYFSVSHDTKLNKVKFCFVDNGAGILNTIHLKFSAKIANLVGINKTTEIIERAFDGEFGSRTRLTNRGRGLKVVKKLFEHGFIKNLKVVTNNVFYDFDNKQIGEIPQNFHGTFYFWEIDKTCKR